VINTLAVSEKGPEGKIVNITKRARKHLAGTIRSRNAQGEYVAYVPLLGAAKPVIVLVDENTLLKVGDRVILDVETWGVENEPTTCKLSHVLGTIDDPTCDVRAAVEEFDIRSSFPKAAIDQAKKHGKKVSAQERKNG
jgi:ribonuclease R